MSDYEYTYKRLTDVDTPLLKELLVVFADAFDERVAYQSAVPHDAYLARFLANDNRIVIVALHDRVIVGGLVAYVLEKFEQERSEIYIYDLAVAEAHRRRGIATGLIVELKKIGRDLGAYIMFVQADHGDGPAIALYESLGTREDVYHFDISVDSVVQSSHEEEIH